MELASKYDPQAVESKWYEYWLNNKLFSSKPDGREPYTVVIPPPNVTGVLHMGHMLNNTIQDILVRRARMEGKNACWVPGTDHASIATEAKVVGKLAEKGIKKTDLSREKFLEHAWDWTHEHGGIILKQLRKLGCSCDWDRTSFTMDETRSKSVIKVFCDLYDKGLIYRGVRMVNWDPQAQTALSDEEVIYKDEHGNSNIRKVEPHESKNFSDYYRANFKTIYDFAKTSNSKLSTVDNCVRFANMGRLILESHARSNYRLEYATSSAITQLMKFYNISEEKEEEFQGMLDVINSLSHGLSFYDIDINQISPREIRDAIRKLISIMFSYDKNHVIAMIGLADDSKTLAEIESW